MQGQDRVQAPEPRNSVTSLRPSPREVHGQALGARRGKEGETGAPGCTMGARKGDRAQGVPEGSLGGVEEAGEAREGDGGVERQRRPQPGELQVALHVPQEQLQLHPVCILQHRHITGTPRPDRAGGGGGESAVDIRPEGASALRGTSGE